MKTFSLVSISLLLSVAPTSFAAPTAKASTSLKEIRRRAIENNETPEKHIVVLKQNEKRSWNDIFHEMGYNKTDLDGLKDTAGFRTSESFGRTFTMKLHSREIESMSSLSHIEFIQKDHTRSGAGVRIDDPRFDAIPAPTFSGRFPIVKRQQGQQGRLNIQTQNNAPYNLGRISSMHSINKNGRDYNSLNYNYAFDAPNGKGVDIYVLDSGVNIDHVEFQGRAKNLFTAFNGDFRDLHGHGTNVAGIVGSRAYGVAKRANIYALRVLDAENRGSDSDFINALQAVVNNHNKRKNDRDFIGSIINFSIGGQGDNALLLRAFQGVFAAGIHVSNSGMNDNVDACTSHPQKYSLTTPMITTGNSDINDVKAAKSNFGKCITLHAPGEFIISTGKENTQARSVFSGTSQASPAVVGVMADLMLRFRELRTDPQAMKAFLLKRSGGNVQGATGGGSILNNVIDFNNNP
ncbi:hypothetical protein H072_9904 [Dactylellina haptotyla CBS 200.50]|uniref:Peptidase S8/S53 domain-containing protein n=1 Tax=Dactylellina haptotyla (strain CBS 200.50) TaxID=1284197 RepID=S8A673_DACHA|nr:hypothetical protein H072_9904 [Dactylellina haptotyla CBS 200.50]